METNRYEFKLVFNEVCDSPAFDLACSFEDEHGSDPEFFEACVAGILETLNDGLNALGKQYGATPGEWGEVEIRGFRVAAPAPAPTPDLRGLLATRPGPQDDPAVALADAVAEAAATATPDQLRAALAALGGPVAAPAAPAIPPDLDWEPEAPPPRAGYRPAR